MPVGSTVMEIPYRGERLGEGPILTRKFTLMYGRQRRSPADQGILDVLLLVLAVVVGATLILDKLYVMIAWFCCRGMFLHGIWGSQCMVPEI